MDEKKKARRDRAIRWAIWLLLLGGVGAYAMDKRGDALEAEEKVATAEASTANLEGAAAIAVASILELQTTIAELRAREPETVIEYVDRPVVDSARIVELEAELASIEEPAPCPVCEAIDSTRILEFAVVIAGLEAETDELRNRPPPDPVEIRVVEIEYRRRWWEYIIVAGASGVGGYLIGNSGESSSSSDDDWKEKDKEHRGDS